MWTSYKIIYCYKQLLNIKTELRAWRLWVKKNKMKLKNTWVYNYAFLSLIMIKTHIHWMKIALKEAEKAYTKNEIPVGAVIIHNGKIIGKGYNQVEKLKDPTAHAEIIAITSAVNTIGSKFLENCSMYVTLEPCIMCSGAIILSRLENLIFGAKDPKSGAFGSVYNINEDNKLNHKVNVISGILEEECALIIKKFFLKLRNDS